MISVAKVERNQIKYKHYKIKSKLSNLQTTMNKILTNSNQKKNLSLFK